MSNLKDEIEKRYGPYIVERRIFPNYQPEKSNLALWECKCIYCGAKKIITGNNLRFGKYSHFCRVCGNGKE